MKNTPLHMVRTGQSDLVTLLIKEGADIAAKNATGESPLHEAAFWGSKDAVETLIRHGAAVGAVDSHEETPLYSAAASGDADVAGLLISEGCDVNHRNVVNATPLHTAASHGSLEVVELLLANGAEINVKGFFEKTPVLQAAERGHAAVVATLIAHGADVWASDQEGATPLSVAQKVHRNDIVALIRRKMEAEKAGPSARVRAFVPSYVLTGKERDHFAWTQSSLQRPLTAEFLETEGRERLADAALRDYLAAAELLVYIGVDVNSKDPFSRSTALHWAAASGSVRIARFLLSQGADIHAAEFLGETALHNAAKAGRLRTTLLLIEEGADIEARSHDGETPLHLAASWGRAGIMRALLEKGAKANARNKRGQTPLDVACATVSLKEAIGSAMKGLPGARYAVFLTNPLSCDDGVFEALQMYGGERTEERP